MTKFHSNGEALAEEYVFTTQEEKPILNARTLAAAFWVSYFTLHWLLLLEVIEPTWPRFGAALYFFLTALLLSIHTAATKEKKK